MSLRRWYRNLKVEGIVRKVVGDAHPAAKKINIDPAGFDPEPLVIICDECGPIEIKVLFQLPDHRDEMAEVHLAEHMHRHHGGPDPWEKAVKRR